MDLCEILYLYIYIYILLKFVDYIKIWLRSDTHSCFILLVGQFLEVIKCFSSHSDAAFADAFTSPLISSLVSPLILSHRHGVRHQQFIPFCNSSPPPPPSSSSSCTALRPVSGHGLRAVGVLKKNCIFTRWGCQPHTSPNSPTPQFFSKIDITFMLCCT
jgi:hypothetical protein